MIWFTKKTRVCPNCKSEMVQKPTNSDVELRYFKEELESGKIKHNPRLVPVIKGRNIEYSFFCTKCVLAIDS